MKLRNLVRGSWLGCSQLLVILWVALASPGEAARVYYVNQPENGLGRINAVKLDGTAHTTLYTAPTVTDFRGIAVDPEGGRIFFAYADSDPATLARTQVSLRTMSTAGEAPAVLAAFPDETFIGDVEWDHLNRKIYFAQTGSGELRRMNRDGSSLVTVLTQPGAGQGPYFFGLDLVDNLAYWGIGTVQGQTQTAYSRGSLTTGMVDPVFTLVTPSRTRDISVDRTVPDGRLYWCDRQNGAVYNRLVNGGPLLTSRSGLNAPHGLVLDVEAGKGYVADTGKRGSNPTQPSAHRAVRFNLDGSGGLEILSPVDPVAEPFDIAVDFTSVSYADWKTRFFATNALNTAPGDDPDNDGRSNLGEYAFFTHPTQADAHQRVLDVVSGGIQFARRLVTDATYRVEVSLDLQTWHWNNDTAGAVWTVETGTAPRDLDSQRITVSVAPNLAGESRVFFRLRAL